MRKRLVLLLLLGVLASAQLVWARSIAPERQGAAVAQAEPVSPCGGTFETAVGLDHQEVEHLPRIDVWFEDDVIEADRTAIRTGLGEVQAYLAAHFTAAPPESACVDVRAAGEGPVGSGRTKDARMLLITSPEGWPVSAAWDLPAVAAHEYVHVWQDGIAGTTALESSPVWLVEGMAHWIALQTMTAAALIPAEDMSCWLEPVPGPLRPRLSRLETLAGWRSFLMNYKVSLEAVDALVDAAGELPLQLYLSHLGDGDEWDDAFARAFGLTPSAFYQRFDPDDVPLVRRPGSSIAPLGRAGLAPTTAGFGIRKTKAFGAERCEPAE